MRASRDAWCYNASKADLTANVTRMIQVFNTESERFAVATSSLDKKERSARVDDVVDSDPTRISWSVNLKQELLRSRRLQFDPKCLFRSLYRPFTRQWTYFNRQLNERVLQMPRIFPTDGIENRVICLTGLGESAGFSCLMADSVSNFHFIAGSQCFPLYLYDGLDSDAEEASPEQSALFGAEDQPVQALAAERRDAITEEGLAHFRSAYPGETITREDIFYYVYGLLHSPDYRERFADNLGKELPRIPRVKTAGDFWAFSQAGRKLADLHLNYESVEPYPLKIDSAGKTLTSADFRVEKMRYGKKGKDKDLTTLHYNDKITLTGIPVEAYDYVVNGKPALDWVVERQGVKTDKNSGIVNDANDWAVETMGNPRYPLELFQRVVTVSLETMKIVRALPKLDITPSTN